MLTEQGIFADPKMKLLIFTEHKDTLDYLVGDGQDGRPLGKLREWGLTVTQIHGGMKIGDRDTPGTRIYAEREFREECQVLVATEAAGEGINLQFCWFMINYDIPWNPVRLEQRMGRIHRYGQEKDCLIFNFVATNTREGRVLQKLFERVRPIEDDLDPQRTGKVFNVLGDVFPANQLERMVREMYARNLTEEVIKSRIVEEVDTERFRQITDSTLEGLAKRELNLSAIVGKSAEAKERRLVPEVIEDFFVQAGAAGRASTPRTGQATGQPRLPHRPGAAHPVADRRAAGAALRQAGPRVQADRLRQGAAGRATRRWNGSRPAIRCSRACARTRWSASQDDLRRGAVFYDLHRDAAGPAGRVRRGDQGRPGQRAAPPAVCRRDRRWTARWRCASRPSSSIWRPRQTGTARPPEWRRPARPRRRSSGRWSSRRCSRSWPRCSAQRDAGDRDDRAPRRDQPERADRPPEAAVWPSCSSSSRPATAVRGLDGRPEAGRGPARRAERAGWSAAARSWSRSASAPSATSSTSAGPGSLPHPERTAPGIAPMVRDDEIERIAVEAVIAYEEARGWVVESVESENRGFDLISRRPHPEDPQTAIEVRFIEVKGRAGVGEVALSSQRVQDGRAAEEGLLAVRRLQLRRDAGGASDPGPGAAGLGAGDGGGALLIEGVCTPERVSSLLESLKDKILLAKSPGCQSRKRGRSGRFETGAGQVIDEAADVDGGGQGHRLQMGLGEAAVASGPQFEGAHRL